MLNREKFECEWQGPSDSERRLIEIATEYYRRCDAFDDAHLTGRSKSGESMPATNEQFVATNRNALMVKRELIDRHGLTGAEFQQALRLIPRGMK